MSESDKYREKRRPPLDQWNADVDKLEAKMSESDKYREKRRPPLDQRNADVDKLEAKIRKAGVDPKTDCDAQIEALQPTHCYKVKAKPFENRKDIVNAWKDLKKGLEKHMDCL